MKSLLVAITVMGVTAAQAQVNVSTEQSKDKSQTSSQVEVSAGDHTFVPLTVETKTTKVDADTTRTESTTQARQNDGSYMDWRTTNSESKKISDSVTERTSQTVEKDRQGAARVTKNATERITKGKDGAEQATKSVYRRDSSGGLVVESESTSVSRPNSDGSISTTKMESRPDTNGALKPVQRVEETTTKVSGTDTKTARTIQTVDHMKGDYTDSARETINVRKDGSTTTTETLVQKPVGGSWQSQARILTTETKLPDGSTQREIVEQVRPSYASSGRGTESASPLVPQQKTIEREVLQPNGTTIIQQQILRRDINGDWKPATFSTEAAQKAY